MHAPRHHRRSFLSFGAAGLVSLPAWRPLLADGRTAKAKQVLVIFEQGGVSQMDSFDPKPGMAAEHASPYKAISTKVPGLHICELLSRTAEHVDKLSIVRCMIPVSYTHLTLPTNREV